MKSMKGLKCGGDMYVILVYDINLENKEGQKVLRKVFKICKKYLSHFQYSVFRGEITPSNMILLSNELKKVIKKDEDFVCIIKLKNDNVFGEEILGCPRKDIGESLIL